MTIEEKLKDLKKVIKEKKSILVAFSGGVDSSLIAKIAYDQLGERAMAATINSEVYASRDLQTAKKVAGEIGIRHVIIDVNELTNDLFLKNPQDRCYHCKQEEIRELMGIAKQFDLQSIAYGVNISDFKEHRPGIKVLQEQHFFLPLVEAGIGKEEIPALAKMVGLSNYDLPSTTCLASRIPYGTAITKEALQRIERAESILIGLGFRQARVRYHGHTARIEVDEDEILEICHHRQAIVIEMKRIGFTYITLDLQGYRSGSMDEILEK